MCGRFLYARVVSALLADVTISWLAEVVSAMLTDVGIILSAGFIIGVGAGMLTVSMITRFDVLIEPMADVLTPVIVDVDAGVSTDVISMLAGAITTWDLMTMLASLKE